MPYQPPEAWQSQKAARACANRGEILDYTPSFVIYNLHDARGLAYTG